MVFGQRLGEAQGDHSWRRPHVIDGDGGAASRVAGGEITEHGPPGRAEAAGRGLDVHLAAAGLLAGLDQDFQVAGADHAAQGGIGRPGTRFGIETEFESFHGGHQLRKREGGA